MGDYLNIRIATLAAIAILPFWAVWTGIRPPRNSQLTTADRVIRIVGGVLIFGVLALGLLAKLRE
jgi:hypothetical protein